MFNKYMILVNRLLIIINFNIIEFGNASFLLFLVLMKK